MYRLSNLKLKEVGIVEKINTSSDIKKRLYDVGLVEKTKIKVILVKKNSKAYLIRNSLIAIRNSDSKNILVGECFD